MFVALQLKNFKSFPEAELKFGPITTVIGANAAGKSNLRDALKFLHAVGRGLTLPEIFGGSVSHGWSGIRGGAPGTVRNGQTVFSLELTVAPESVYRIDITANGKGPLVSRESLYEGGKMLFDSHPESMTPYQEDPKILKVRLLGGGDVRKGETRSFPAHQPMLSQVAEAAAVRTDRRAVSLVENVGQVRQALRDIRFIDFEPKAMRQPAVPGAKTISETGENLSSVLRYLVEEQQKETVLASWIKALTPMDVVRMHFEDYPDGKMLAVLEEAGGRRVPLSNASDGTLRFLGILASVISPEAPSLLCFEEIETGLHPVRVQLVSELLQKETSDGRPQVMLTTHSPALVSWLGRKHREHAHLAYRLPTMTDTRLKAFSDIPSLEDALQKAEASRLFETGWFEETMLFAEGDQAPISFVAEDGEKA